MHLHKYYIIIYKYFYMNRVSRLVDCSDPEAVECLNDFVENIQLEMTVGGMIPFTIPADVIAQLIKNAKIMFQKMYEDFTEEMFLILPESEIQKKKFNKGIAKLNDETDKNKSAIKDTRGAFMLPERVVSVVGVYEIGGFEGEAGWGGMLLGKHTGDISLQNLLYQNAYDRSLAIAADTTAYYVATESFLDISRQIFQHPITFRYNRLTNNLRFLGELPRKDVIVDVLVAIPDCDMYNDDLFRRYVIADCKENLGRVLGTFSYQLPGNVSINVDQISNEGRSEKESIIQEIKDMSGSWYIMTF